MMEPKKPMPGKLQKTPSRVGAKSLESPMDELNDSEKTAIIEMKKLYMDTIKLDVELQNGIYKLEKDMEPKQNAIYEKRAKLLSDFRKKCSPGDSNRTGHVANFWLRVLKASYTEFITPNDEKILTHLIDIRSKLFLDPEVKFTLEFYFEPNEYFTNSVLTKTYFLNALPNPEQPLSYDGAEIVRCEGCQIFWKRKQVKTPEHKKYLFCFSTFFDFFNPPAEPEDRTDPKYVEINALLQNDFELGFYLKERVIPKAVLFFTGEIVDCQFNSDSDEDEDEDDDQDCDDNEDDDENEDDTSSANSNENLCSDQ